MNFAHGTVYMMGAYCAVSDRQWLGKEAGCLGGRAGGGVAIALLAGQRALLFRYLTEGELYRLFKYSWCDMGDVEKIIWGTRESGGRPPG